MKNTLMAGLLFLLALINSPLQAQSAAEGKNNYTLTTTKIPQLTPILMAAESLMEEDGESFGEFRILVCGKAVESLSCPDTMAPYLERAEKTGAEIIACGYSMQKLGVLPQELAPGVKRVDNAILENLQLQKQGYISLGL